MRGLLKSRSRGVAIIEFALVLPIMMLFLGGVVDFSGAFRERMALSQGVASGANYAFALSQTYPDQALNTSDIVSATKAASPSGSDVSVVQVTMACAVNGALTPGSSDENCPDGMAPGDYLKIQATHKFQPLFPVYSMLSSTDLSEIVIVRTK